MTNDSRLLTFAKNDIETNVKERVLSKNIKNGLNVRYIYDFEYVTKYRIIRVFSNT